MYASYVTSYLDCSTEESVKETVKKVLEGGLAFTSKELQSLAWHGLHPSQIKLSNEAYRYVGKKE